MTTPPGGHEKELRLALVCYGGISLAVYMHGITKEVWHLARASQAHHDAAGVTGGSAAVYAALLAEIEAEAGLRVRVLADIVAGASAGAINGIFLAQAIATGQSLDPLTDLWLSSADVEALIDPRSGPSTRLSKLWALPLAWMAAGRSADSVDALVDEATRSEVRAKLSHFVRSRWFEPPFGGAIFTGLLLDAFAAMTAGPAGPRLLPGNQPLDLYVTVTDFTGHPERLQLHSPPEVVETEHRVVIAFTDDGRAATAIPELVFAARATSSFPGAFPPFTVAELDGVLRDRGVAWPGRDRFLQRILPRHHAAGGADLAVLIDGSVLANAPFRPALDALKERPARRQVDRRFVYIDPHPRLRGDPADDGPPGFFQTILGAISALPRQQPIRDNLDAIAERSARVERLRGIVTALRPHVETEVEALFGRTIFLDRPTARRLASWRRRALKAAVRGAGYAYLAYERARYDRVVDAVAAMLGGIAGDGRVPRARMAPCVTAALTGTAPLDVLRDLDWGYRIRRLRLLARRVADVEATIADPATIAPMRTAVYDSLATFLEVQRHAAHASLHRVASAISGDASAAVAARAVSLDLVRREADTDRRLAAGLAALDRATRRTLLLAYLGFPWFDVATLPLLGGEGLDEFDPIKVDRISPDDATAIRAGGAEATLKGIQFNSFGAFFSRAYRENDYLWGRLHGADRLIDITVSTLPPTTPMRPGRVTAIKRAAFRAILDEEEPRLTAIASLFGRLRAEIG